MIAQIREIFHGAGLSTTQAAQVYGAYMRMLEPHLAARREAAEAGAREAAAAVRELGAARMTGAKAAFKRYVGDDEALALRLEDSLGDGEMIRMFDRIALDMAEDDKGALGLRGGAENRDREYSMRDIIADAFARHK